MLPSLLDNLASLQRLESLNLSSTVADNRTVEQLQKLPRLRDLDLSGTQIDDMALKMLSSSLIKLTSLNLTCTAVSGEEVDWGKAFRAFFSFNDVKQCVCLRGAGLFMLLSQTCCVIVVGRCLATCATANFGPKLRTQRGKGARSAGQDIESPQHWRQRSYLPVFGVRLLVTQHAAQLLVQTYGKIP